MDKNLEEIAESEVLQSLRNFEFDNPESIKSESDGVSNLKEYIKLSYGVEMQDWDYQERKTNINVSNLRVIQNGVEISKMKRMDELSDEEFVELCEKNPVKVIGARGGQYIVNGNHRLLTALIRGIEYIPVQIFSIRDRGKSTQIGLALDSQSAMVRKEYGAGNVLGLRESLVRRMNEYQS